MITVRTGVADTDLALQLKRRYAVLVLGHEILGLEPLAQGQFGGVNDRPPCECGLGATRAALEYFGFIAPENGVIFAFAFRADESLLPACLFQGILALGFFLVIVQKLAQTQAFLKLDAVDCHGRLLF